MTHTRYSPANIILLVAGGLIAIFNLFLTVMTAGFGADPVHDFKTFAASCVLVIALAAAPFYLIAFRWSGISTVGTWSVTLCCALITLVSGELTHFSGLLILLTIQSLIMGAINSSSKNRTPEHRDVSERPLS
jgi:hypothetical protein